MQQVVDRQSLSREFLFPGNLASLPDGRDSILKFVHEHCSDEQRELEIFLSLQEALANAVLHGCLNDERKLVRCTVEITPSEFRFVIQDPGPGFPATASVDPGGQPLNLGEHGRGIQIIRSLMDEIMYVRDGSELHMTKLRAL